MNPDPYAHLPYRACVGQMVIDQHGRVWIGCRSEIKNDAEGRGAWWQMPQGGIEANEDPYEAALRELYEETGIKSVELIAEHPDWLHYDLPTDLIGNAWKGRFRGQKQKWFAFRFTGDDSEIQVDPPPGGHQTEFVEWRWANVEEVMDLIIPFKRSVYRQVLDVFAPLAKP